MKKYLFKIALILFSVTSFAQIDYHLAINEISFSNHKSWIELYNYGEERIPLNNAYFSDDVASNLKWKITEEAFIERSESVV